MKRLLTRALPGAWILSVLSIVAAPPARAAESSKEPLPVTVFENLKAGRKQTVITYGTSLTIKGTWAAAVGQYFEKQYPGKVIFTNSAKAGMHSDWGVANFEERVLSKNPDLVFIEFSINDAALKNKVPLDKSQTNLDDMVKALRQQNAKVDIVLQTMDLAWDSPRVPDKKYGSERPNLEAYYDIYRRYAREHNLPLVDNQSAWQKLLKEDPERYHKMVPDGIHPSSTSSMAVTWPAVEALLEKARRAATADTVASDGAPPSARIARFAGDRAAAISYTFDDGLRDQYTLAVPMLNEAGFKGTFFVIAGKTAETPEEGEQREREEKASKQWGGISWPELKAMADQGHEIASHTWSHRGMPKIPPADVEPEISKAYDTIKSRIGKPPLTFAFPYNSRSPEAEAAVMKSHLAFRSYQIGTSGKTTLESLNAWADKLVGEKKWGVVMAHAIANGYAALTDPEILRTHFTHVKGREREIWVDTFANVARYEMERDNAELKVSGTPGNITCTLVGTLDPKHYDVPLTIVIDAKATSVKAERAGKELPVRLANGTIQIDASPDTQPITVTWK